MTVPVTLITSNRPAPVPSISTLNVELLTRLRFPVLSVPGLLPGDTVPPLAEVTLPATVPLPPSVAPDATDTALPLASEPLTSSVPALTDVAPT